MMIQITAKNQENGINNIEHDSCFRFAVAFKQAFYNNVRTYFILKYMVKQGGLVMCDRT